MARFSQAFLQGLLQPSYQQGLFEAARGLGQMPGIIGMQQQRQQEKERREKGIIGGTLAIQQAAQSGALSEEELRSYAGSMQGLGVPPDQIMKTISDIRTVNSTAAGKKRTVNYVDSLGEEYRALYDAGFTLAQVAEQFAEDNKLKALDTIIANANLDIDPKLARQMTPADLSKAIQDQLESKKTAEGNKTWAAWVNKNPEINDSNRASAIEAAAQAFGANGPEKVADLEAKQLANKAKREGQKIVKGVITLNTHSVFADVPGMENKSNLKPVDLAVDNNGNLTDESIKFLEANATSAFVPSINKSWSLGPKTSNTILGGDTPSGQGREGSTLGQIIGPAALEQALTNLSF